MKSRSNVVNAMPRIRAARNSSYRALISRLFGYRSASADEVIIPPKNVYDAVKRISGANTGEPQSLFVTLLNADPRDVEILHAFFVQTERPITPTNYIDSRRLNEAYPKSVCSFVLSLEKLTFETEHSRIQQPSMTHLKLVSTAIHILFGDEAGMRARQYDLSERFEIPDRLQLKD